MSPFPHKLVLASQSPYRRAQLTMLGISFDACAHEVNERASEAPISELALSLAKQKAESVVHRYPGALILGCDQIAVLEGERLDKPGSKERAEAQLQKLQGKTHRLETAIALRHFDGSFRTHVDIHELTMRPLGADEIRRYIDFDQPLDCCGAYKIESLGISLFDSIRGDDFSAITGLPLMALSAMLRDSGFSIP